MAHEGEQVLPRLQGLLRGHVHGPVRQRESREGRQLLGGDQLAGTVLPGVRGEERDGRDDASQGLDGNDDTRLESQRARPPCGLRSGVRLGILRPPNDELPRAERLEHRVEAVLPALELGGVLLHLDDPIRIPIGLDP